MLVKRTLRLKIETEGVRSACRTHTKKVVAVPNERPKRGLAIIAYLSGDQKEKENGSIILHMRNGACF
jgi:hypothetical protein